MVMIKSMLNLNQMIEPAAVWKYVPVLLVLRNAFVYSGLFSNGSSDFMNILALSAS